MARNVVAQIDDKKLGENLALMRKVAAGRDVTLHLRANAYGHDIRTVAPRVVDQASTIVVDSPSDSEILRSAGFSGSIRVNEFQRRPLSLAADSRGHSENHAARELFVGCSIFGLVSDEDATPLENTSSVMTLASKLISIIFVGKGEAVGYGASWTCPEDMNVGAIALGYGDGYPRVARKDRYVTIRGRKAPMIGRVSMDLISVDLRGIPNAEVGDRVVAWGGAPSLEEVAAASAFDSCTLCCRLTSRVLRELV